MSQAHDHDRKFDAGVYDHDYFEGDGHKSGYLSYDQAKGIVQDQFYLINSVMREAAEVGHPHGEKPTALDLACAYGHGVAKLDDMGWDAQGVDISAFAIAKGKASYPLAKLFVGDAMDRNTYKDLPDKSIDLVTGVEFFEHIPSANVKDVLMNCADKARWGVFVINARTGADQDVMGNHGDHGHLNNHNMSWWIARVAEFGDIDFDKMYELSKAFEAYNAGVHWHNRVIVVKFV